MEFEIHKNVCEEISILIFYLFLLKYSNERRDYISNKYEEKMFCRLHPLHSDENAMNEVTFNIPRELKPFTSLYKCTFCKEIFVKERGTYFPGFVQISSV